MTTEQTNLATARAYLRAVEGGATGEALARWLTPDVVQEEFPNRLVPAGARRGLQDLLDGAVRGQKVMQAQRYEVLSAFASGEKVALEVQWTGTLAIPLGSLAAGDDMRARLGVLRSRDGARGLCPRRRLGRPALNPAGAAHVGRGRAGGAGVPAVSVLDPVTKTRRVARAPRR